MDIMLLLAGIPIGMAANACYQWAKVGIGWISDPIRMSGTWVERIHSGTERQFSIGEIRWNVRRSIWDFEGTNFHNNGVPFCHWKTITSYLDRDNKRFYYTFLNTPDDSSHTSYTGFGVLELAKRGRSYVPCRGSFAAGNPGETFRSHSMIKVDRAPANPQETRDLFARTQELESSDAPEEP